MRNMADSIYSRNIPVGAFKLVAGYLNGAISKWSQADWDRHAGHSILVRITISAFVNDGDVLDIENGDATPVQGPPWVLMRRSVGKDPSVYCSEAAWPAVRAAFRAAGVKEPHYWVAAYPGEGGTIIPAGAIAHQWIDRGPIDESIVADFWPGIDTGGDMGQPVDISPAGTNAIWMQQCVITWPPGSPNAKLAVAQGAKANADGSVTESHPAALWLEVIAGREALEMQELDAFQQGMASLQVSTAQVDADLKAGLVTLGAQLTKVETKVDAITTKLDQPIGDLSGTATANITVTLT